MDLAVSFQIGEVLTKVSKEAGLEVLGTTVGTVIIGGVVIAYKKLKRSGSYRDDAENIYQQARLALDVKVDQIRDGRVRASISKLSRTKIKQISAMRNKGFLSEDQASHLFRVFKSWNKYKQKRKHMPRKDYERLLEEWDFYRSSR